MISVAEALQLIEQETGMLEKETIPLSNCLNRILAEDIISPIDMPPFAQSAMDGYAIKRSDTTQYNFTLIGEIKAGDDASSVQIGDGEAVRIFTGGMVPSSAVSVVKQEIVEQNGSEISVTGNFNDGENIRPKGEQVAKGALAATKGTRLSPGAVGYLTGLGIETVAVTRLPKIAIIVTGNELIPPSEALTPGKIYESNAIMLKTALQTYGFECSVSKVQDDYEATKAMIATALKSNDLILLSGGISVGDYDFVGRALNELGTKEIFHKIKQKPGKPVYFGVNDRTRIFALPGNPASALTCFYVYVLKGLQQLTGSIQPFFPLLEFELDTDLSKKGNFRHFLKASVTGGIISPLPAQSSAMLSAFTNANAILILPEEQEEFTRGSKVQAYLIN